jgi:hypothetical protein
MLRMSVKFEMTEQKVRVAPAVMEETVSSLLRGKRAIAA